MTARAQKESSFLVGSSVRPRTAIATPARFVVGVGQRKPFTKESSALLATTGGFISSFGTAAEKHQLWTHCYFLPAHVKRMWSNFLVAPRRLDSWWWKRCCQNLSLQSTILVRVQRNETKRSLCGR
jgi:hypothetical protein